MDEVLIAEDVRREYGDAVALDGVSLRVGAGEVVALVGPNGAGKTTFVRAVTGTTDAEGEVSLFGRAPAAVDRSRLGLLPQEFAPQDRLTPRELLAYYGGLYDDARDVEAVLSDVGIDGDAADTWYENLSGGQRRRTCVGTALINEPDLLVLDEPTTGIDPAGRRSLWRLLEELAASGVSILLTTHDMAEAERLADRVGLLAGGELVALDDPASLIEEHGGDSTLVVRGEGVADVGDALSYPTEPATGKLTVHGVEARDVGAVVDELSALGVAYDELTWSEPDLEDVYLRLAGTRVDRGGAGTPRPPGSGERREPDGPGTVGEAADPEAGASAGGDPT